jgi:DNA helicase II / ATP-dependent DNA helicase PcrA
MQVEHSAEDVSSRFDQVLVDEYQDANRLPASILLALKPDGKGLTVVGDDAQSIYSFRAATVRNILDFPGQFSPPQPSRLTAITAPRTRSCPPLTPSLIGSRTPQKNSTPSVLQATVRSLSRCAMKPRRPVMWPNAFLSTARHRSPRNSRQCCSAPHHSGQLEIELARRNIPFVNAAASNSWKQRTLRICSLCSAGPKTSGTGCPGSRRRASSWCRTRNRGAPPRSRFQFAGRA